MKFSDFKIIPLLGFGSIFLGAMVLFGWYAHIPVLIQLHSSLVPMQINTALGFVAGGAGLVWAYGPRKSGVLIAGGFLVLLAGLTLIQYIFEVDLGIDQLLMESSITVKTSHPGRMAPNTAAGFLLVGISLLILSSRNEVQNISKTIAVLGGLILALGIAALSGYLLGVETAYGWGNLTQMAVHTASGFAILGLGIIVYAWKVESGRETGNPRWTPSLVGIASLSITLLLWQAGVMEEQKSLKNTIKAKTRHTHGSFEFKLKSLARGIGHLVEDWKVRGAPKKEDWLFDAEFYTKYFDGVKAIEWVDSDFRVRWVAPLEGNESALGLDLSSIEVVNTALIRARDERTVVIHRTRKLVQGGSGFLISAPIFHADRFRGFIHVIANANRLLEHVVLEQQVEGIEFNILEVNTPDDLELLKEQKDTEWSYSVPLKFYGNSWEIIALPKPQWLKQQVSMTPVFILGFGIFVSFLLAQLAYLVQKNKDRAVEVYKAQEELQASYRNLEVRGQNILRNLVDPLITINEEGVIDIFNPAAERAFGYSAAEVVGKNVKVLMPEPYHREHDDYLSNYRETGKARIIGIGREVVGKRKDGSIFPIELSVNKFKVAGKEMFIGICRDITERKRDQEKIERVNKNLEKQNWLKNHHAILNDKMRGDQDSDELAQNIINCLAENLEAHVGSIYLAESETLKMAASFAFSGVEDISREFKFGEGLVGQAAMKKESIQISNVPQDYIRVTSGLGDALPANIIIVPFLFEDMVMGVVELGSFKPFTDWKLEFLDQVGESIAIAVNSALRRKQMRELLVETQVQTQELIAQKEEVEQVQEELRQTNQQLEEQTRDLEQQKRELEEKSGLLKLKMKEVETAGLYKSEFLANMSHELRTPLNSLLILSQLLLENKEKNLTERQMEFIQTIHTSGSDLLSLINDILDLSKVEAGKMDLHLEEVSLTAMAESFTKTFQHQAEQKELQFKVEVSPEIPSHIRTDAQRFEQIINNFLSNAFKFTEKGSITVKFHPVKHGIRFSVPELNPKNSIGVSVSDTGKGIPKEKQLPIFEAFQQEDGTTSRKYGGTGLGLSISKELARLLGGEISMISQEAKGSTFTLYIPEKLSLVNSERGGETQDKEDPVTTYQDESTEKNSQQSVLVIEDDLQFSKIVTETAAKKRLNAMVAGDGELGLELAKERHPTAIILDIRLPGMNGIEVLTELKADPATQDIPVYVVSAKDDKARKVLELGAVDFIKKPVSLKKLDRIFSKIFRKANRATKQILVVEDDEDMRNSIFGLLKNENIHLFGAETADEAMEELRKNNIDCMILDLGLVGKSGFDLLHEIKNDKTAPKVPVIIYTGQSLNISEEEELAYFSKSVIVKGSKSPERLMEEIKGLISGDKEISEETDSMDEEIITGNSIKTEEMDFDFSDKKILIADDDIRNIFALTHLLEEKGAEVFVARNGLEAINSIKTNPDIALILMDIMMPEMDGYEAIMEIRKDQRFKKIPIIAITAKAMKNDRNKCLDAGASDYLAKPIDKDKLFAQIYFQFQKIGK